MFDLLLNGIVGNIFKEYRRKTQIIVEADYFSKWIEAKTLASITEFHLIKILRVNLFSRYCNLRILIGDSRTQLTTKELKWLFMELHIDHHLTTPKQMYKISRKQDSLSQAVETSGCLGRKFVR